MRIAIRELKSTLSRVLARAQAGELIEVTSHHKPIARITGIPQPSESGWRGLMAAGTLSWNGGKPNLAPPASLAQGELPISQIILEERG
jgi:prevent-host-death family protein